MTSLLILEQVRKAACDYQESGFRRYSQAQFHINKLETASTSNEILVQSFFARIDQDNSAKAYAMARSRLAYLESLEQEHARVKGRKVSQ